MMMMNGGGGRSCSSSRFPFTASQWQELEHQALVFKYMVSGMPIPPDLLYTIRRSLQDSSSKSSFLIPPQPPQSCIGWNSSFQMGFGRKIDPEPGRCRRTDGKKWRCSKEAYPDSKYCERHMHRGRNRSRKPVEILSPPTPTPTPTQPPNAIPITNTTSITAANKATALLHHYPPPSSTPPNLSSYLTSAAAPAPSEPHFLSPHFPSRPASGIGLSSQESTTNFFLESYTPHQLHSPGKGSCRNGSMSGGSADSSAAWKLAPLAMGSSSPYQMKHNANLDLLTGHKLQNPDDHQISRQQHNNAHHHHYYHAGDNNIPSINLEMDDHHPKKVMHHFLDEWPPKDNKDSWPRSEDKMSSHRTQLSISIPNSLHDFFMTQKW